MRVAGLFLVAALALAVTPRPAAADDTLEVAAGFPSGIDAVENVAGGGKRLSERFAHADAL